MSIHLRKQKEHLRKQERIYIVKYISYIQDYFLIFKRSTILKDALFLFFEVGNSSPLLSVICMYSITKDYSDV